METQTERRKGWIVPGTWKLRTQHGEVVQGRMENTTDEGVEVHGQGFEWDEIESLTRLDDPITS